MKKLFDYLFTSGADSALGKINARDFIKGLLVAALTVPATIIYESLERGSYTVDWNSIKHAAIIGAAGYLMKQVFSIPAKTPS